MKIFFIAIFLPLFGFATESDLVRLYQQEYAFLQTQKQTLQAQSQTSLQQHKQQLVKLEADIQKLQSEYVKLSSKNEEQFDKLQRLEKVHKQSSRETDSLATTFLKAQNVIQWWESKILGAESFSNSKDKTNSAMVDAEKFENLQERAMHLLDYSTRVHRVQMAYRNKSGDLTQGEVIKFGPMAAISRKSANEAFILGPIGEAILSEIEPVKRVGDRLSLFFFDSPFDATAIKKPVTLFDRVFDFMPIFILGIMFAIVAGLFVVFVRE